MSLEIPKGWYLLRPDEIIVQTDKWWSIFGQEWKRIRTKTDTRSMCGKPVSSENVPTSWVIRKGIRPLEGWGGFPLGESL